MIFKLTFVLLFFIFFCPETFSQREIDERNSILYISCNYQHDYSLIDIITKHLGEDVWIEKECIHPFFEEQLISYSNLESVDVVIIHYDHRGKLRKKALNLAIKLARKYINLSFIFYDTEFDQCRGHLMLNKSIPLRFRNRFYALQRGADWRNSKTQNLCPHYNSFEEGVVSILDRIL